ncbi:MAG: hypothetical protein JRN52_01910 [Nitrososphaerota archaeon]|nr:hypothetical protein [Nitrososphaerota archaeon]
MVKIKPTGNAATACKKHVPLIVTLSLLLILAVVLVPNSRTASAPPSGRALAASLVNESPSSSSHGIVVLGTDYSFYSTTYNTYITWAQTLYANSVNYFTDHVNFTDAGLGNSTSPAWTFGVGVNGDNLTISQITTNYIELDDTTAPTVTVDIYFYYVGSSPLSVVAQGTTISASSFLQSLSSFSSCSAPCVLLNSTGGYIEISNQAGSNTQNLVYPGAEPTSTTTTTSTTSSTTSTSSTTTSSKSSTTSTSSTTTSSKSSTTSTSSTTTTSSTTPPPPPPVTSSTTSTTTSTSTTSSTSSTTAIQKQTSTSTSTSTTTTTSSSSTTTTNSTSQTLTSSTTASTTSSTTPPTTSTLTSSSTTTTSSTTDTNTTTASTTTTSTSTSSPTSLAALFFSIPYATNSHPTALAIGIFASEIGLVTAAPFVVRKVAKKFKQKGGGDSRRWRW